jgi:hypothetical protein
MKSRCTYEAGPGLRCTKAAHKDERCKSHSVRRGGLRSGGACADCGGEGGYHYTVNEILATTGHRECTTCKGTGLALVVDQRVRRFS